MSYCRFENTSGDLRDCTNALQEAIDEGVTLEQFVKKLSSDHERRAFKRFRDQCEEYISTFHDLEQTK